MGVAIGRRIGDDLDAFAFPGGPGRIVLLARGTINCTQIDRWISRRTAPCNIAEFAGIIGREKDIVMGQIKPRCRGMGIPHQR